MPSIKNGARRVILGTARALEGFAVGVAPGALEKMESDLRAHQDVLVRLRADLAAVQERMGARLEASEAASRGEGKDLRAELAALRAELGAARPSLEEQARGAEAARKSAADGDRALADRLDTLLKYVDSIRKELFYELRYKLEEIDRDVEAEVLNPEGYRVKAAAMPDGLRVNLGSGVVAHRGSHREINVDLRAVEGVDIRADVRRLPFEESSLAELSSFHLVEHFPEWELRNRVLPYWFKLMKPGGLLRVVCPDAEAMMRRWSSGEMAWEALREVTFGAQEYDGNQHYNMFTPDSLAKILQDAGFVEVERAAVGRPNGQCFEMEILARRAKA